MDSDKACFIDDGLWTPDLRQWMMDAGTTTTALLYGSTKQIKMDKMDKRN